MFFLEFSLSSGNFWLALTRNNANGEIIRLDTGNTFPTTHPAWSNDPPSDTKPCITFRYGSAHLMKFRACTDPFNAICEIRLS